MSDSLLPAPDPPKRGYVRVPSYTKDDTFYDVHEKTLACPCPARTQAAAPSCKHGRLVALGLDLGSAVRGLLADGETRVLVLESMDAEYHERTWGFDQGVYSHELAFDAHRLLVISTNVGTGVELIRSIHDPATWKRHIPPTQHYRQPKYRYRRPNYELSTRPVIN